MEKQKEFIKFDETISHLWAIKETEYDNVTKILNNVAGDEK